MDGDAQAAGQKLSQWYGFIPPAGRTPHNEFTPVTGVRIGTGTSRLKQLLDLFALERFHWRVFRDARTENLPHRVRHFEFTAGPSKESQEAAVEAIDPEFIIPVY